MQTSVPPRNHSASIGGGKLFTRANWLSTFLLAASFLSALAAIIAKSDSNRPEAILLLLATISTLAALTRRLPSQNVLLVAFIIALIGSGAHALGAKSGIPFGQF